MYWIWNRLLIVEKVQTFQNLKVYNRCDVFACICSLGIFFAMTFIKYRAVTVPLQIFGIVLWMGLLCKWYIDFYFHSFKKKEELPPQKQAAKKGGKE
jgi:hypothetical protein